MGWSFLGNKWKVNSGNLLIDNSQKLLNPYLAGGNIFSADHKRKSLFLEGMIMKKQNILISLLVTIFFIISAASVYAKNSELSMSPIHHECRYLYWFDNNNKKCELSRFCDAYMYLGLNTFDTKASCLYAVKKTNGPSPIIKTCQNFPGPQFCPGGINEIVVTGTDKNGCSIYSCKKFPRPFPRVNYSVIKSGNHPISGLQKRKLEVYTDQEAFNSNWSLFTQSFAGRTVDFSSRSVILLSLGACPTGGYSISVKKIEDNSEFIKASVIIRKPGSNCVVTQALTSPYQFFEVESIKPLIFEEKVEVFNCE